MLTSNPTKLEKAVVALCFDIQESLTPITPICNDERALWDELIFCLLSSQVSYETALSASQIISDKKMLPCDYRENDFIEYEKEIYLLLSKPMIDGIKYRFPVLRAKQITNTAKKISSHFDSISDFFVNGEDVYEARKKMIYLVEGFGPKTTSMYFRNIGYSSELAILDSHVMKYMKMIGLADYETTPQSLSKYECLEKVFVDYSVSLGFSTLCVDYAAWIVMRVNFQH